jgi:hypothetical protein
MTGLPIVFVHKGDSFYLKYCIENAKKFSPNSRIYLICEGTSEEFEGIEKLNISDFSKYSKQLEKIYVHKSGSNPEIELFCLRRWLILKDFLEQRNIQKVFTADSDVLLYVDVDKDSKDYSKYDYLLAKGLSAGLTIINNKKVLDDYCELVLDYYKTKIGKVEYEPNGTITDMSFWKEMKKRGKFKVGDITDIIDGAAYDAGLLIEQKQIPLRNGKKHIIFKNFLPYGGEGNKLVRLKCLHCQGPTKFYMKYFVKGNVTLFNKIKVNSMMWLRDNVGPKMPRGFIKHAKKVLTKLGF